MRFKLRKDYILHMKDNAAFIIPLDECSKSFKIDGLAANIIFLLEKQSLTASEIFSEMKSKVALKNHTQLKNDIDLFLQASLEQNIIE